MDTTTLKTKLEEVSSFFNNPLTTPIGQMIDHLTTPTGDSSPTNWPLLLELCDLLNSSTDSATFTNFTKALRKKLQSKNWQVIELTLLVIEVSVKNCAERNEKFRGVVLNREFLMEVVKWGAGPSPTTPTSTQDRTLALIQSLYFTFKANPQVTSVYEELRDKGVEFPAIDLDQMAPIVFNKQPQPRPLASRPLQAEEEEPILHPVRFKGPSPTIRPTPAQKSKLRRDLAIVSQNLAVLNELLSEKELEEEERFLELLFNTCKEMQSRLGLLLSQIDPDEEEDDLISELLQINDELNNGFLRYTRHVKNKAKSSQQAQPVVPSPASPQQPQSSGPGELIDFSIESTVASGAIPKKRRDELDEEELDEIAVLQTHTESDFLEMEQWLKSFGKETPLAAVPSSQAPTTTSEPLSSSEFDKFLEERARRK